jgi:glycine/D-amino acid oxidase-like deaminating enzyme
VAICAGGITRPWLKTAGITVQQYFTHAELIEIPAPDLRLQTLVMPAVTERFTMEAAAAAVDVLWDEPGYEPTPPILDAGAVQFLDGRIRIGQISRTLTDPQASIASSEQELRQQVGQVLPAIAALPGTWQRCLVAFSGDRLPLVGEVKPGLQVFSGFSNPLAIVPPLARRFAQAAAGQPDNLLPLVSPLRFANAPEAS